MSAERDHIPDRPSWSALPNLLVIGAMKCGTTALHGYLDVHPEIAMSEPKELNFFFGSARGSTEWADGNWHRGVGWYAGHFDPLARVRGESSPGYTSPDHPEAAERIAAYVPAAHLVYLVRDPVERAWSHYRHHREEGTEVRPVEQALLDPDSHYVSRGRYAERLAPFLSRFARYRIAIVAQEELAAERRRTLRALFAFVGADEQFWSPELDEPAPPPGPPLDRGLAAQLADLWREDADRLRELAGRDFPCWSL